MFSVGPVRRAAGGTRHPAGDLDTDSDARGLCSLGGGDVAIRNLATIHIKNGWFQCTLDFFALRCLSLNAVHL